MRLARSIGISAAMILFVVSPVPAQSYNEAIVAYCQTRLGKRVGTGECAHFATEALRVAGAEFTRTDDKGKKIADDPKSGDYVWGELIRKVEVGVAETKVNKPVRPGDIIQFGDAAFGNGLKVAHHTAIVAAVDRQGQPTAVFQQNTRRPGDRANRRFVTKDSILNLAELKSGRVMVYRAMKPSNPSPLQVTLVNNARDESVSFEQFGKSRDLAGRNSANGFITLWGRGNGANRITVDGTVYTLKNRGGYEVFAKPDGKLSLREVE